MPLARTLTFCKDVAKHVLPEPIWNRARTLFHKSAPPSQVFTEIHRHNGWGDGESASGPGSTLEYTAEIRQTLPALLQTLSVQSMLDLPCGDFNWMRQVELPVARYIGADVVPALIEKNQRDFGTPGREFRVLDLTRNDLPVVDLLMCRDCLMHLSVELIDAALANILRSNIRYLLTTTHPQGKNKRIRTGEWFPINLEAHPYRFPPPLEALNDWMPPFPERRLALWEIATLRQALPARSPRLSGT